MSCTRPSRRSPSVTSSRRRPPTSSSSRGGTCRTSPPSSPRRRRRSSRSSPRPRPWPTRRASPARTPGTGWSPTPGRPRTRPSSTPMSTSSAAGPWRGRPAERPTRLGARCLNLPTRALVIPPDVNMVTLLGPREELLRTMERAFPRAQIHVRGNEFHVSGPSGDIALVERTLDELLAVIEGGQPLNRDAVERSIQMLRANSVERPADVLTMNIVSNRGRTIRPKTLNQKHYVDAIDDNTIVFGIGPAGTGKTYLAMAKAVAALQAKQVNRIILTRPAVEAGERLGFLPGTLNDKIDPYLRPLYDALHDMVDPESIPRLMAAGTIEVAPLAYMRGRSLNDAFIILDEAQNTSPEQMKMFLTRLDLPGGNLSGLRVVRDILAGVEDVHFSILTAHDVVRHRLVGEIVNAYGRWDSAHGAGTDGVRGGGGRAHGAGTDGVRRGGGEPAARSGRVDVGEGTA